VGCRIIFSMGFPMEETKPHLNPLWQLAEKFGAECTTQIDEHVTHVVAISLGTNKVCMLLLRDITKILNRSFLTHQALYIKEYCLYVLLMLQVNWGLATGRQVCTGWYCS
jgi:hypothetical protein